MIKVCNRIIEYSFYALFLLVPIVFTSATSELFELNKMWLTWGLTIIIGTAWLTKMILQRRILLCRTPLDIPIFLFLLSQIISTIFSLDSHVSVWGYYSRFNGGLLSIMSYVFLYYAFVTYVSEGVAKEEGLPTPSNGAGSALSLAGLPAEAFAKAGGKLLTGSPFVKRLLSLSLISGLIVALWGLPSHFGYDPTCFIFRGTFDVSCWTADFMPRVRIFSTLGQPNWLAAYLAILLPITLAFLLNSSQSLNKHHEKLQIANSKLQKYNSNFKFPMYICYFLFSILFYVDLLYTGSRSGILAVWVSLFLFFIIYFLYATIKPFKLLGLITFVLLLITFIIGTPFSELHKLTFDRVKSSFLKPNLNSSPSAKSTETQSQVSNREAGGTDSGSIRNNVWPGAINVWRNNPFFGTGVETFAFAYYKYKPIGQNLTSEWNFLYNKAHNEYLNYLATTGIFGLGTYLLMIGYFLFLAIKKISKSKFLISNQIPNSKSELGQLETGSIRNLALALLASYISILITNFFGFSVVIVNVYLFMIPAFVFVLTGMIKPATNDKRPATQRGEQATSGLTLFSLTGIFFILVASCFLLITLFQFWRADTSYALGYNLDRAGEYQKAYESLYKAVQLRGDEPVFKDELSINEAIIAAGLIAQKDQSQTNQDKILSAASTFAQEAVNTSNEIISKSSNNAVFWKTRTRVFYTLSQVDSKYLSSAMDSIEKASVLAPNDANIIYNLGVLYGQNNDITKGIEALEKTVKLKPDYRDAHYALGLYYRTASLDEKGKVVIDSLMQKKAIAQMQYILDHLNPNDSGAKEAIKNWGK